MFGSLASCEPQQGEKQGSVMPEGAGQPPIHSAICNDIFYLLHGMILKTFHKKSALAIDMQRGMAAGCKLALQCALVLNWLNNRLRSLYPTRVRRTRCPRSCTLHSATTALQALHQRAQMFAETTMSRKREASPGLGLPPSVHAEDSRSACALKRRQTSHGGLVCWPSTQAPLEGTCACNTSDILPADMFCTPA